MRIKDQDKRSGSKIRFKYQDQRSGSTIRIKGQYQRSGSKTGSKIRIKISIKYQDQGSSIWNQVQVQGSRSRTTIKYGDQGKWGIICFHFVLVVLVDITKKSIWYIHKVREDLISFVVIKKIQRKSSFCFCAQPPGTNNQSQSD